VSALQSPSEVEEGRSLRFTNFRLQGTSSAAWLGTLRSEVGRHWTVSKHLHSGPPRTVKIEFVVERNGRISKVRRVAPDARLLAADPALLELDSSAEKALHAARLPPLPPDSGSERLTMQALFTVAKPSPRADEPSNAEPAADQPASAAPEAPPPVDEAWARSHGLVPDYDQPPQPIDIAGPDYPKGALAKRIEGTVLVDLAIDARGHVADARVAQSIPALDTAAIECVKRWRFEPARKAGKPVAALGRAPVVFRVPPPMPGIFSPPSPGEDGPHLMVVGFESGGANLMRWFSDLETEVYAHWKAPDRLRSGPSRSATYAFEVARDGELSKIRKSDAPAVEDPDWLELQLAGHVRFLHGRSVPS
jgi:TonB family protein